MRHAATSRKVSATGITGWEQGHTGHFLLFDFVLTMCLHDLLYILRK